VNIIGQVRYAECGEVYDRPLWGMNLVTRRYERCPQCKRWHITGKEDEVKEEDGGSGR